jgi:hypothetical protein
MAQYYLTQRDIDDYGHEMLDVSQRAALQAVAPHLQSAQTQIDALNQQNADLQRRLAKESRRALDDRVAKSVPDFRAIDRDPEWHRWLMGIDGLSGRIRQQLLNEAIARSDARQVKEIFERYRSERGGQSAGSTSSSRAPSRGTSGKNFYTRDAIKQLYEQHRRGAWAGREAEWAALEADLFQAQHDGRVERKVYLTK